MAKLPGADECWSCGAAVDGGRKIVRDGDCVMTLPYVTTICFTGSKSSSYDIGVNLCQMCAELLCLVNGGATVIPTA